uniref:Variant surface glycoprotein 1125.4756 n=1 Tax=Trypanosoma brucei TaxID=5691 RepID=A0A1J0RAZ4_9TRYP|nr:variant surface glycoprotein 1125.4756 [Trypanosoma brucei]
MIPSTAVITAVVAIVCYLGTLTTASNVANLDNAHQFNTLCKLIRFPEATLTLFASDADPEPDYTDVLQLNMSVATDNWKTQLSVGKKGARTADIAKKFSLTTQEIDQTWKNHWDKWIEAHDAVKDPNKQPDTIKKLHLNKLDAAQHAQASMLIRQAAAAAEELYIEAQALKEQTSKVTPVTAKTTLTQAVYGATATAAAYDNSKAWTAYNNNRGTACDDTKATSAAATLLCLCAKAAADQVDEPCVKTQTASSTWTTGSTNDLTTNFNEILGHCPKIGNFQLTSSILKQITTDIRQAIRIKSGAGYFGAVVTSTCGGTSSDGVCVKYNSYTAEPTSHKGKIKWLDDLEDLAIKLDNQEQAISKFNQIAAAIKTARNSAFKTPQIIKAYATPQAFRTFSSKTDTGDSTATKEKQDEAEEKECNKIDKQTDCQNPCKWDKDKKDDKKRCTLSDEDKKQVEKAER